MQKCEGLRDNSHYDTSNYLDETWYVGALWKALDMKAPSPEQFIIVGVTLEEFRLYKKLHSRRNSSRAHRRVGQRKHVRVSS